MSWAGEEVHKSIPPEAFQSQMAEEPGVLLDVRTPKEFAQGHLKQATLINFYDEDFKNRIQQLSKDKTYYVYCRSGGRSGKTLNLMKEAGFKRVFDLQGGITAWTAQQLPLDQ